MMQKPPNGEIRVISLPETSSKITSLLYGQSGAGKTTLSATAPPDILYLQVDGSSVSIKHHRHVKVLEPAIPARIRDWNALSEAVDFVATYAEWLNREHGFNSVVLDSGTEAAEMCANQILTETGPTRRIHENVMSQADYGVLAVRMLEMLRKLLSASDYLNVVVTAQVRDQLVANEDEGGGASMWRAPRFKGRETSSECPALFDLIGYLGVVTDTDNGVPNRMLLVQPVGNREGKMRVAPTIAAPVTIIRPNLEEIFAFMNGGAAPSLMSNKEDGSKKIKAKADEESSDVVVVSTDLSEDVDSVIQEG